MENIDYFILQNSSMSSASSTEVARNLIPILEGVNELSSYFVPNISIPLYTKAVLLLSMNSHLPITEEYLSIYAKKSSSKNHILHYPIILPALFNLPTPKT